MEEGQEVSFHILRMKGYVDYLDKVRYPISDELVTGLVLNSLTKSFDVFVMRLNIDHMVAFIFELHVMLQVFVKDLPKVPCTCDECGTIGYWKGDFFTRIETFLMNKPKVGTSGIYMIKLVFFYLTLNHLILSV